MQKADLEVQLVPMRPSLAQEVTLYLREQTAEPHGNGEGGGTVSPHWRRGHWRWQAFGVGRRERRRLAIPSVLVKGHLFVGAASDTMARYRVRGE
jgi:hypothetical protein